jgi:hypothetical protein
MPDLTDAQLEAQLAAIGLTAPQPQPTVRPTGDAERILGQIARGEVDASKDAARRIAARQQAAYGDLVWGTAYTESLRLAPPADPGLGDAEIHDLNVAIDNTHPRRLGGAA